MQDTISSNWKFYRFFKQGSNEKSLIKYEHYDDYLCFWRCLSYHKMNPKPENNANINKMMKYLFKDYNKPLNKSNKTNYPGVEFVAYDKKYDNDALDNDEYDKKE
jgi:hypothetical protein